MQVWKYTHHTKGNENTRTIMQVVKIHTPLQVCKTGKIASGVQKNVQSHFI